MELLFGHFKRRINEQLLTWMSGKLFNLPSPFYFIIIIIFFFFSIRAELGTLQKSCFDELLDRICPLITN